MYQEEAVDEPFLDASNELECAICMETFKKPKLLYCMHTFCEGCINKLVRQHEHDYSDGTITCPICRYETKIGRNYELLWDNVTVQKKIDMKRLSKMKASGELYCNDCDKDIAVDFCHNCKLRLCKPCTSYHIRSTRYSGHAIEDINTVSAEDLLQPKQGTCDKHKQDLRYFCETCRLPACSDCTLSKIHQSHSFRLLEEIIEEDIESLKLVISCAKQQQDEYTTKLKKAEEFLESAERTKEESEKVVEETFRGIFDVLETEKENLLTWLDNGYETSKTSFNKARDDAKVLGLTVKYLDDMSISCPKEKVSHLITEGNERLKGFAPSHNLNFAMCSRKIDNTSYVETIKTAMTQISFLKNLVPHPLQLHQPYPTQSLYSQNPIPSHESSIPQYFQLNGNQCPSLPPQYSNVFGITQPVNPYMAAAYQSQSSINTSTRLHDGKYLPENTFLPHAFTYTETQFPI